MVKNSKKLSKRVVPSMVTLESEEYPEGNSVLAAAIGFFNSELEDIQNIMPGKLVKIHCTKNTGISVRGGRVTYTTSLKVVQVKDTINI